MKVVQRQVGIGSVGTVLKISRLACCGPTLPEHALLGR